MVPHLEHLEWKVRYEPGFIETWGGKSGKVVLTEKRETTGPAAAIRLTVDRMEIDADGEATLKMEALDKGGRPVPTASNLLGFKCLRRGSVDRHDKWRSELPGERQGTQAVTLQRSGTGDCAAQQDTGRDPHRGGEWRPQRDRTEPR
jgi:hypothetical protein